MQPSPHPSHHSWPYFNEHDIGIPINAQMDHFGFFPPALITAEDFSDLSQFLNSPSTFPANSANLPLRVDHHIPVPNPTYDSSLNLEELEPLSGLEIDEMFHWLEGNSEEQNNLPLLTSVQPPPPPILPTNNEEQENFPLVTLVPPPAPLLILPTDHDMNIDNQLRISHLTKAFAEAIENGNQELAPVISRHISQKASPVGEVVERLCYYSFKPFDKHVKGKRVKQEEEYLKRESCKNLDAASEAFYRIFPYGMMAHFTANSTILDAMPVGTKTIHIIDFDIGDGIQWSSLMEDLCRLQQNQQKQMILRLTSIKWKEKDHSLVPFRCQFDETKKRLCTHARLFGLKVMIAEVEMQELGGQVGSREWLVFNCMQGLPHMGRRRSRRHAVEFLRRAKENISISGKNETRNWGIITFGDGDAWERFKDCSGFGVFFASFMEHYQALLESIEWSFPIHLQEARIAMECLFVEPFVSSSAHMQKWDEVREGCDFELGSGLEGWRLSNWSLMEAKEMVREGKSLYRVRIDGESENEMVLEWNGTSLVRVSAWR